MKIKLTFLFVIFFNSCYLHGQSEFNYNLKKTPDLKIPEKRADSILFKTNLTESEIIKKAFDFSRIFYKQNNLQLAIKYAKIQNKYSKKFNLFPKHYHTSYYLIGKYYMWNDQIDSAISYYKKALKLDYYPKKIAQSLCQLAHCYRMKGELHKSLNYYKNGIELLFIHGKNISIVNHIINFSLTCNQIKTKQSAQLGIKYIRICDSIINNDINLKNGDDRCYLYNNLGNLYQIENNYNFEKAKENYLKTLKISSTKKNNYIFSLAQLNLGELYLKKNVDSSLYYLKNSQKYSLKLNNYDKNALISEIFRNFSRCYKDKRQYHSALEHIDKSLKTSFNIPLEKKLLLNNHHFEKVISRRNVVLAFKGKVEILNLIYNKTKDPKYLRESIETVNTCDAFINYTIQNSTEINTKFLWRDDVSEIYNYGVLAAYNLNDHELLNSIIEKNKAFLLTQSIKENNSEIALPHNVKQQLKTYKNSIFSLEEKSTSQKQKDSLFNIKLEFERFKDSITVLYPEHFSKRNNIQPLALEHIKTNLDSKSVILSYHLDRNNNNLFGLFTSKTGNYSFKKEIDSTFYEVAENYKRLISKSLIQKSELQEFYTTSNSLYNYLFPTKESKQFIEKKSFIVIANDILQNIPFEALNTNTSDVKYLIEDHNVSYAYSASFLEFNNALKRETSKNLAAYAPITFANQKSLEATQSEVNTIQNQIDSDLFTATKATKNNFLTSSGDYKILHLATHASSSNNPAIYFSKDTLKLHELYTHKTNADLVVLSACETNLGEIKKGEGVFSLSRGFFYSGAKSVISSLWNVNDVSTSSIMKDFYTNLDHHQSKSEALNNAKRKYLKEHSLSDKSPYYWASFVLIGDTSPTYPSTSYLFYLLGFVAFISIILFFFKKRG
ncbi:CHAT domain-containing tetratricopeptide repeat protein [Tenacibaculum sp. 190524A05c]|uniref:CHAT domain-containing protein n=1 Tax=Tenacibaculum platacis TaxID=3137852 RepID=UPI0032B197A3